jgi:hypothetical protein
MIITSLISGLLSLACYYSGFASDIQGQTKRIDAAKLPVESASASDFVSKGWVIEEEINGDLNGDSIPDVAVKLVEEKHPDFDEANPPERRRALLILFKLPDGRLRRAAVANKVLQCTRCGGAFYGMIESPANIEIAKGALIIRQDHGSREITSETYRFKFDPQIKRFALIGMDISVYDRVSGTSSDDSVNFLTGVKITTVKRYDKKRDADVTVSEKRERIVVKKRFIEDVDALYQ